jgi:hypothetical protein
VAYDKTFNLRNYSAFSLKQLKNSGNLNKISKNVPEKFIACKIVGSRLNFYRKFCSSKEKVCEGLI